MNLTKKQKEELAEEIEECKKLGRSARRKKESELNKKYNTKGIRILSNKTFTKAESLSKSERRELLKDKNLLKELIKIIHKYFPNLMSIISKLTDKRNKSYIKYNIRSIIMTRLLALICGIVSMNEMENTFNTKEAIANLAQICSQELKEVPNWQTIQDVFEQLEIQEIEDIRHSLINAIIRSKMFDKFRYQHGTCKCIQILVDATGISSHDYNLNDNCITRNKDGKIKYYKYVLEAKIVFGSIVISLDTEWIENTKITNENEKQDCEVKAFKRMAPRIKKKYPKLKFIITGDALYASTPMIDICKDYKWFYIFNLKKDRLKTIYEEFEDNINYENEVTKSNYFLSSNIEFKGNKLNVLRYIEISENKTTTFNYITNLPVNNHNIEIIIKLGRSRWKIENEGFNIQKNGTFCISHLCSRNENAIKIHYLLIQFAHLFRQLLEYGSIVLREMKLRTKKEVSSLITNNFTSIIISDPNCLNLNFQLRFDD